MAITKEIVEKARELRRQAAAHWGCEVSEIDWPSCMSIAMRGENQVFEQTEEEKEMEMKRIEKREKENAEKVVLERVGLEDLADYLTAPHGHYIGVYGDGLVAVGDSVGNEIAKAERPVMMTKCPGLHNLDMSRYREDCEHLSDEAVIRLCCEEGDMTDELDDLHNALSESITQ